MWSKIIGLWLMIESLGSMIKYKTQPLLDHSVRIIRLGIGLGLLLM
jgi:hypothetical protein